MIPKDTAQGQKATYILPCQAYKDPERMSEAVIIFPEDIAKLSGKINGLDDPVFNQPIFGEKRPGSEEVIVAGFLTVARPHPEDEFEDFGAQYFDVHLITDPHTQKIVTNVVDQLRPEWKQQNKVFWLGKTSISGHPEF